MSLFVACGSGSDSSQATEHIPERQNGVRVTLSWTAVGDDGEVGTAARYEIRYALDSAVLRASWDRAAPVSNIPTPSPSGSKVSVTRVLPLWPDTTYYFGIKAVDESGNWSSLSNVSVVHTPEDTTASGRRDRRRR
ncbi:MAG: hypothetical protein RBT76_00745 [candidate division Zixibacteria bacterium]|jgi:chitodextrinase|nr:hypothetical protein [candidate division Zixibacteria bacterium]